MASISDHRRGFIWRNTILQGVILFIAAIMCADYCVWCAEANYTCPLPCNCTQRQISCDGLIPSAVPDTVIEIVLFEIDSSQLWPGRFCKVSWKNISRFSILQVNSKQNEYFDLQGRVFICLGNLRTFKLSSQYLRHFSEYTFIGLTNVKVFELSNCKTMHWNDLSKIFSVRRTFPRLTQLVLSGSGIYDEMLDLNQDLIHSLSERPISYLDLSFTNFIFNFSKPGKLCETLTELNDTGAVMQYTNKFNNSKVCSSLKSVDDSDSQYLRNIYKNAKCINDKKELFFTVPFFRAVKKVYVDKFVTKFENFIAKNCTFHVFDNTRVIELHSSQNYFPHFDFKLINDQLEHLDISDNGIETINLHALSNLSSLLTLDLSKNTLHKAQNILGVLFKNTQQLRSVDLSSNSLRNLPLSTFLENHLLQKLFLSNNYMNQISFNLSHLFQLTVLDLRNNDIKYLNRKSRLLLDTLIKNQQNQQNITTNGTLVRVLLDGNPFSCACANLQFLNWFVRTSVFSETRHKYKCQMNGQNHTMDEEAVKAARKDCQQIQRKRLMKLLLITITPFCVSIVISSAIILHKRHRRNKLKQQFVAGIRNLRENVDRFPVFLSYSSDDDDFVKCHILHQLQDHLQTATELDRELVCHSDRHFRPGRPIVTEIFRCLKVSKVFVAVISKNYCTSRFCQYEIEQADLLEMPVIPIFIEHVDEDHMSSVTKKVFEKLTRVTFAFADGQFIIQPSWPEVAESIIQLL